MARVKRPLLAVGAVETTSLLMDPEWPSSNEVGSSEFFGELAMLDFFSKLVENKTA